MNAKQFNKNYPTGSHFTYQPNTVLRGGRVVKTVDVARDMANGATVVEINVEPYFANVNSLKSPH